MARPRPLVAGNWKMNGTKFNLADLDAIKSGLRDVERMDVAICPPATLISRSAIMALGSALMIGAQDCHPKASGAFTGDIAAEMIADAGGRLVIVGHSERRVGHGEDDVLVRAKAEAAWRAELLAVVCVGESEQEQQVGLTLAVIDGQLAGSIPDGATAENLVVAYEPVWAIGSGKTPSADDIGRVHAHMRTRLTERFGGAAEKIRLLYGGSVKPDNAGPIFKIANVDGALVGGASLKPEDFLAIVQAVP